MALRILSCPACGTPLETVPCKCPSCGGTVYDDSVPIRRVQFGMTSPITRCSTIAGYACGTISCSTVNLASPWLTL